MASSLLVLLDDIATVLDDVALLSRVAAKKTAGVLGDDLALNAQQVSGFAAEREILTKTTGAHEDKPVRIMNADELGQAQRLVRHVPVDEALVDAFIAATQQHRPRPLGQLLHALLGEALPRGAEEDDWQPGRLGLGLGLGLRLANGLQTTQQRLDQHHHAGATAKGAVVHTAVVAIGMVTQRPQAHVHLLALEGAAVVTQGQLILRATIDEIKDRTRQAPTSGLTEVLDRQITREVTLLHAYVITCS